jgi:drug/metabolite transporter (DMT)-like permease
MQSNKSLQAIGWGLLASVFFSATYIVNSFLSVKGGHWAWTTALRYLFMVPMLAPILLVQHQWQPMMAELKKHPMVWITWGGLGFGVFYAFLTYAAMLGPGWLIAGVFQFTIVAGLLISPFVFKDHRARIPKSALGASLFILVGIFLMQWNQQDGQYNRWQLLLCVLLVLAGAFLWPLANRKLVLHEEKAGLTFSPAQRVVAMSLGSLPVLLAIAAYGFWDYGWPGGQQLLGSAAIALSSGVIASVLFYKGLNLAKHDPATFAAVEATQAMEIIVTLTGEMLLLGTLWPGTLSGVGMLMVFIGMAFYAWMEAGKKKG